MASLLTTVLNQRRANDDRPGARKARPRLEPFRQREADFPRIIWLPPAALTWHSAS